MPVGGRNEQRMQAKANRIAGQRVTLLIPPAQSTSTSTPYNIASADTSVDLTACTREPVYAVVEWQPGQFQFGEGGRVLTKTATVEIAFDYSTWVTAAYAVELVDGEIMLKTKIGLNESQTAYLLTVGSHLATKQ